MEMAWISKMKDLTAEGGRWERKSLQILKKLDESIYKETLSLAHEREENDKKRFKKLKNLKTSLGDIQQTLRSMNETQDVTYFQNLLESLETKFSLFKSTMAQEFDALAKEENTLTADLVALSSRVDSWMADHESQDRRPSATAVQEINEHQRIRNEKLAQQKIEIGIIDRKLAAIGAKSCGGWDARDHDAFLRSWAQSGIQYLPSESNHAVEDTSPDNPSPSINSHISHIPPKQLHALRKRLSPILPGMDMDSIDQHIEWYLEVQYLLQAKKSLLSNWKNEKRLIDDEHEGSTLGSSQKASPGRGDPEKEEKKRIEIKKKLMNWQKQKEEEKKLEEMEEKKRAEDARRNSEKELLERQQANRMKLQSWREDREKEIETKRDTSPIIRPRPKSADPEQMRRRSVQNIEKAKEKHHKIQETKELKNSRFDRQMELGKQASLSVVGEHVESKLHASTKASNSHRLTSEELDAAEIRRQKKGAHEGKVAYGGYDLKFVGRAIPAWTRPP